ncbi:MAG: cell division protein ZapA [Candidatus Cloacimonetes bacterium HGW-Cloacimonetes-1]|jgi:cell division protein ZapA (FtsZ GTPase activity inhibitor)|nr:MAG: cell division protein ZapA [Candidatus Cloacimonetes bacterium HGW-Cloacimonetes-1]
MQSVEVEIYGRKFKLRSDNPDATIEIVDELNRKLAQFREQYDNLDFTRLLLLVTLQQQEETHELIIKNRDLSSDLERMNQMISKIIGDI